MKAIRDLRADEIDCRVQSVKFKDQKPTGVILLLYKDARVDMNILDETFGAENWQRDHYERKGNLFCRIGVKLGDEWVWKSDCGTESQTEAQKGEASDSFKRAGFNWGIGRELYTSPFIFVRSEDCKITDKKCSDKFSVTSITIKDKVITALTIRNDSLGKTVYTYGAKVSQPKPETVPVPTQLEFAKNTLKRKANDIRKATGKTMKEVTDELLKGCSLTTAETIDDYEAMIALAEMRLGQL